MPGQAACARRPVTSPRRGRSASAEPSGLTGRARMTRWAGYPTDGTLVWFDGSVAAGADTPSGMPIGARTWARLWRTSRAVVYRTAKRRGCAAGGGRRVSPGRQGGASAPGGRKRQRSLPEGPRPLAGSVRRSRMERGPTGRRPRLAASGSVWQRSPRTKPRRTPQIRTTRSVPSRARRIARCGAGSGHVARMGRRAAPDRRDVEAGSAPRAPCGQRVPPSPRQGGRPGGP